MLVVYQLIFFSFLLTRLLSNVEFNEFSYSTYKCKLEYNSY